MYHSGNQMIDPDLLFEKAQLQPGMHIADLGCGRLGHIVFPGAKYVGPNGLIYAVDVRKEMLESVRKRASLDGLLNVQTVWADLEQYGKTAIPTKNLDVAFIINVLFQSNDQFAILNEAKRLLKHKARLVIVDWNRPGLTICPPAERMVDFHAILNWARGEGFGLQDDFDMGNWHRGLVLYKND